MALFYFNAKLISRGSSNGNSVAAAAYRSGSRYRCERTGTVHNYLYKRKNQEVQTCAIHTPENAPSWTHDREQLWNTVETGETRKNSQLAREIVLGIPIELTSECRSVLLDGFVREAFVSLGMIADYSIHDKAGNPHAHIMLTLRELSADGTGFGAKRRDWNNPVLLQNWRALWAEHANKMLAQHGHDARIDHRTLAEQGIAGPATVHVGRDTGINSDVVQERKDFNALVLTQRELARIKEEERSIHEQLMRITSEIIDLETTLAEALVERDSQASDTDSTQSSEMPSGIVLPGDADFSVPIQTPRRRPLRPRTTAAPIIISTEVTPTCSDF
jgi:ATP-dependent exoDNAse (exonuclease V) alpha subunit